MSIRNYESFFFYVACNMPHCWAKTSPFLRRFSLYLLWMHLPIELESVQVAPESPIWSASAPVPYGHSKDPIRKRKLYG